MPPTTIARPIGIQLHELEADRFEALEVHVEMRDTLQREPEAQAGKLCQRDELGLAEALNLGLGEGQDQAVGDTLGLASGDVGDEARILQGLA
jgi:hypothetical protein